MEQITREEIEALAQSLMKAQKARRVAEHSKVWRPLSTTATDLGYECDRRLVYHRCFPDDAEPYGEELLSIFSEGDLHQQDVRRELALLGYEVVESEVRFSDERLDIAGSIDGKIALSGDRDTHTQRRIPIEIKSTTGKSPATAEDLRNATSALHRRYYAQMQCYLFLTSTPFGIFLFKDKITGLWSTISVELDLGYTEVLLKRAERVRDAVRLLRLATTREEQLALLPERIQNRGECNGCPWANTLCHPADAPIDPVLLATEPELLAQLKERECCEPLADRFEQLDKKLKDRLKLTPFARLIVGGASGFLIEKKIQKNGIRIMIQRIAGKGHV